MKTSIQQIIDAKEITVRVTATHILPATVSDMHVMRGVTGYGTHRTNEYETVLAVLGRAGYSLAVLN